MTKSSDRLNVLIAAGSLWGLGEAGLGMYLRGTCAHAFTGSIMTGVALFFVSMGLAYTRKWHAALIVLGLAVAFKLTDALLLDLPVLHGAIINPIFALVTEALALVFLFAVVDTRLKEKLHGKAIFGGVSALLAVNLFPLAQYVTGIPVCVAPGTGYPMSLYHAPVAVGVSIVTCPLGMILGERLAAGAVEPIKLRKFAYLIRFSTPVISVLCLFLLIMLRIA
jgi:hypothetical protein